MVDEAQKHQEDDRIAKEKVEARNNLDSYAHQIKRSIEDEKLKDKIPEEDRKTIENAIQQTLQWLEKNQTAEKDEIEHQRKELEQKVTPIMTKLYQGMGGGEGGTPGGTPNFHGGGGDFGGCGGGMPNFKQEGGNTGGNTGGSS